MFKKYAGMLLFFGSQLATMVFVFARGLPRWEGPDLWEKIVLVVLYFAFIAGLILFCVELNTTHKKEKNK